MMMMAGHIDSQNRKRRRLGRHSNDSEAPTDTTKGCSTEVKPPAEAAAKALAASSGHAGGKADPLGAAGVAPKRMPKAMADRRRRSESKRRRQHALRSIATMDPMDTTMVSSKTVKNDNSTHADLQTHFQVIAALLGVSTKSSDGDYAMSPLAFTFHPLVWLLQMRSKFCREAGYPEEVVLLRSLPEALHTITPQSPCHHCTSTCKYGQR